jgi:hypothetical protein
MIIDCDTCLARGERCHDCVISVLLGPPVERPVELDAAERTAIGRLADAGLVPPLRLMSDSPVPIQGIA